MTESTEETKTCSEIDYDFEKPKFDLCPRFYFHLDLTCWEIIPRFKLYSDHWSASFLCLSMGKWPR